jgi:hypothetical protein
MPLQAIHLDDKALCTLLQHNVVSCCTLLLQALLVALRILIGSIAHYRRH